MARPVRPARRRVRARARAPLRRIGGADRGARRGPPGRSTARPRDRDGSDRSPSPLRGERRSSASTPRPRCSRLRARVCRRSTFAGRTLSHFAERERALRYFASCGPAARSSPPPGRKAAPSHRRAWARSSTTPPVKAHNGGRGDLGRTQAWLQGAPRSRLRSDQCAYREICGAM